jgi:glycosyltransferase involved in cell wall biosynthesis
MNILVIDRAPPHDLLQGNALIGQHLFRRLRHHHLTLICPAPREKLDYYQAELASLFDTVHLVPRERPLATLIGLIEPALARLGLAAGKSVDLAAVRAFQARVRQVLQQQSFDVIHARQLPMAAIVGPIDHPAKLLELVDSETLQAARRVRPGAPKTRLRAVVARVLEQHAVRLFHACTSVAEPDAQVIRTLAPNVPVYVTPNGVDATHFAPLELPQQPDTVIFTGAMSFPPNITAVLHYYQHILPLIRRELPQVRLIIAGRDPAPEIAALASDPYVTVTGYVDDMRPWLAQSCVMICPMTSGSGIKNKVLEALAMARPVVATTLGIEALEVTNYRELVIADQPAEFAAAVLRLLRDPEACKRMGAAGRELVVRRYTWDACATNYDAIYTQLAARRERTARVPLYAPQRPSERSK